MIREQGVFAPEHTRREAAGRDAGGPAAAPIDTSAPTRGQEFWHGARSEVPILLGVVPFGLIYGAVAMHAQLPPAAAQAMSSVVFAGSAQFIAAQLFGAGAAGLVILMVVGIVNLRHALYSASVAPYIRHLSPLWKLLLAYLLTDEAYVVAITHYSRQEGEADGANRHWYFLGAGLTLWVAWQISTALGVFASAQIPPDWPLSFALPLTFVALVVPALKDRANMAVAVAAALAGLLTMNLPYGTGLLAATVLGIATGLGLERRQR